MSIYWKDNVKWQILFALHVTYCVNGLQKTANTSERYPYHSVSESGQWSDHGWG